ncbi:Oidioi.mRNA.OKI2018_I69.XSR.g14433.t1.cds [Oikopleura dioica]|uniref:Oidioi.mRNA.OKI2018_I69.XSR.g14433.t1.cds n=1 Tax=Oikopleura dioica TaxID=34765 RepID=A0ABN7SF03_OIKDI|nr:Oidioi.mRNA.OKI2018_I69.XSR.g14433.t1.cds [Oikopleura dioica]
MRFFLLFFNVIFATKLADIQKYEEADPNLEQDEYKHLKDEMRSPVDFFNDPLEDFIDKELRKANRFYNVFQV